MRPITARAGATGVVVALACLAPGSLRGQVPDTVLPPVDSVVIAPEVQPTVVPGAEPAPVPISPRGAFIRSMVLPGWGQAAFESHVRGGVYFAGWAANWFMIFRNQVRLEQAERLLDLRASNIEAALLANSENPDSLRAVMDTVPEILDAAIQADEGPGNTGVSLSGLVSAREQQREDWIAWSLFWVLASGIDAYVTAHLSDFPAAIDVRRNADRSLSLGLQVPLPVRRP